MSYKIKSPLPVSEGGTTKKSFTADTVICSGTTSTGALQNVADIGNVYDALTSQGAGSLPQWAPLSNKTFFELLASDPSDPTIGQVWYRTDTGDFKGAIDSGGVGSWSVVNAMNTARFYLAGAGDETDALSFGGFDTNDLGTTERYDGSNWTAKTSMNTARRFLGGTGTASDALSFGGVSVAGGVLGTTERYDGSNWTTKTSMNTTREGLAGSGTAADTLAFGGSESAPLYLPTKITSRYDGGADTWTTKGDLNQARRGLSGSGTADSALAAGGSSIGVGATGNTSEYDSGSDSWTTKAYLNTARSALAAAGNTSNSLCFGGTNTSFLSSAVNEEFNGTANMWSTKGSLNTARTGLAGCGDHLGALSFGGVDDTTATRYATTELWSGATGVSIVTFTVT